MNQTLNSAVSDPSDVAQSFLDDFTVISDNMYVVRLMFSDPSGILRITNWCNDVEASTHVPGVVQNERV